MSYDAVHSSPSSFGEMSGKERRQSVYHGKRRVSVLLAVLCLLLEWECGRHFHELLAQGSGDHGAAVAILENTLLLGVLAFTAAVAMMRAALGFPRLIVNQQGLTRRSLFRVTTVEWNSLSRFYIERINGGKTMRAAADVTGPNVTPRLRHRKDKLFKITSTYRTPVETIVAEIHDCQTGALGAPARSERACHP